MWLPDMGTAGALAGGLVEYRSAPSDADHRLIAGGFAGAEPKGYEAGYAPDVRKYGGYLALESGFLRRHIIGAAHVTQGPITQRSMLTVANYIPAGRSFFAYQALEYDITGPAAGAARRGLSYFLLNARASAGSRVDVQGTYNRGRSDHLADGIIITPSHNPPADGGLKYNPPNGGPADTSATRTIEQRANELLQQGVKQVKRVPLAAAMTMGPVVIMIVYLLIARRWGAFDAL